MSTPPALPFTRKNWILFLVGLGTIALGYVLLRIPPVDGPLSLTVAPMLLVAGYCVILPAAILVRDRGPGREAADGEAAEAGEPRP